MLVAVCVLAAWALGSGSTETAGMNLSSYRDPVNRLEVAFPSSWQRARFPMFARIVNPRSILALSTFPIPHGAGKGECGYVPSQVQEGVGRAGAAVLIIERYPEPGGVEGKLARRTPARPASFQLHAQDELRTLDTRSREWLFNFTDSGRLLSAAVVIGPDVSTGLRADVIRVLNSLRFGPLAPARAG